MRVLMISGDNSILLPGTPAHERLLLQRSQVEELHVIVWSRQQPLAFVETLLAPLFDRFDVITTQDPFWRGLLGFIAARLCGAKLQVQLHTDFAAQTPSRKKLGASVLSRADGVRVVSENIAESLASQNLRAPISVLPIYIDLSAIQAAPAFDFQEAYPQCEQALLVAARLEPEKNVGAALRIMPEVLRIFPKAVLFIAGGGSEEASLLTEAQALGVKEHVMFLGHRSDVFSLYKGADVVLQTSEYEGYGATVIEALASGAPVVSTDVGVAREAGATVVSLSEFDAAVIEVLQSKKEGVLKMEVLDKEEWAKKWKESLLLGQQ